MIRRFAALAALTAVAAWIPVGLAGTAAAGTAAPGTAAAGVAAAGVAAAQDGEQVTSFQVEAEIGPDGALAVTERIGYDFGSNSRHGIEREIDVRERFDDGRDRAYELTDVAVFSPSGAPDDLQLIDNGRYTTVRIGDPDRTIWGRHRYELRYVLRGLMNSFDDHDELYWEATGTRWRVDLRNVTVRVSAPGGVRQAACYAGDPSSGDRCDGAELQTDREVSFRQPLVASGDGVTVVVGLDKGVVAVPPPVLVDPLRGPWEQPPSVLSWVVAAVAVLGTAAAGWLLWLRHGRDRAYVGLPLGLAPAPGQPDVEGFVPIGGGPEPAVAFTPPKGVRPALAGVLLDERTAPVQVSATIVDLAVRGYLRIDELSGKDWELTLLNEQRPDDVLAPYERTLLDALFGNGHAVRMSSLDQRFRKRFLRISGQLADDAYRAGWFRRRPRTGTLAPARSGSALLSKAIWFVVTLAFVLGFFGGFGSILASIRAGWSTTVVGFGLLIAVVIAFLVWRAMPARTALGRATWAQVVGFRRYLATAEVEQLRHEEAASVFSRYLPLAMIFGLTQRWAAVFAQLAAAQGSVAAVGWYTGDPSSLGRSLDDFGRSSGSVFTSSPASSGGSGFSGGSVGGGGGGGGGGSW